MAEQQWLDAMDKLVNEAKQENIRLKAGVRCAAPKLRGHLLELSKMCNTGRRDALERGKAIPKKAVGAAKKVKAAEPVAADPEQVVETKPKA